MKKTVDCFKFYNYCLSAILWYPFPQNLIELPDKMKFYPNLKIMLLG